MRIRWDVHSLSVVEYECCIPALNVNAKCPERLQIPSCKIATAVVVCVFFSWCLDQVRIHAGPSTWAHSVPGPDAVGVSPNHTRPGG